MGQICGATSACATTRDGNLSSYYADIYVRGRAILALPVEWADEDGADASGLEGFAEAARWVLRYHILL